MQNVDLYHFIMIHQENYLYFLIIDVNKVILNLFSYKHIKTIFLSIIIQINIKSIFGNTIVLGIRGLFALYQTN